MTKQKSEDSDESDESGTRYRAPALEKGLDIIEVLASSSRPMPPKLISERLGRSVSELFRMLQVLEIRGYVASAENQSGYELTNKFFSLGMSRGISKNLLDHALPLMRDLSESVSQACYIVVASDDKTVVIGQVDAPAIPSFHIRVGYRQDLVDSISGAVLYAFQKPKVRDAWREALKPTVAEHEWQQFDAHAAKALAQGYLVAHNTFTESVTDIACPIFNDRGLVGAITIPYIRSKLSVSVEECATSLVETATQLSHALGAKTAA